MVLILCSIPSRLMCEDKENKSKNCELYYWRYMYCVCVRTSSLYRVRARKVNAVALIFRSLSSVMIREDRVQEQTVLCST